jgi:TRAP transporter 4TM/12TM fusion protein
MASGEDSRMNQEQRQEADKINVNDLLHIEPEKVDIQDPDEKMARNLKGKPALAAGAIALLLSLFQLYTAYAGAFPDLIQRSVHIGLAMVLGFMMYAATDRSPRKRSSVPDLLLVMLGLTVCGYAALNYDRIVMNPGISNRVDLIFGVIATLLVMELTRRILGWILPFIAILTIIYAYVGPHLPDAFSHRGFGTEYILETLYMSTSGIWGNVTGVSATIMAGFLIFGSLLFYTGGGEAFVDLAKALAGRSYGGPAKVSCISSALFGTISGSAVANVVVDGVFNIPLMKKLRYKPEFAAAVEATASTGGQLTPPVMGAGAFIMAEFISTPYMRIALAATIPALLYYVGVMSSVHLGARKDGLEKIPRELIPSVRKTLPRSAPLFVPVALLIYMMMAGWDPTTAVFWATVTSVLVYLAGVRSSAMLKERAVNLVKALEAGGKSIVLIAALCACAQIVIGMFNLTGLGIKISEMVIGLSMGIEFLALFFTMIVCLILGMGLPTTAAYVLAASVAGPALIKLSVAPIAAHLFIFYFAIISAITPPVCAAVYAAAAIARSSWLKTGWLAVRMGIAGFIAPFLFVYYPSLLLYGSFTQTLWDSLVAATAVVALAGICMGYFGDRCKWYESILLIAGVACLLRPDPITDLIGLFLVSAVYICQKRRRTGFKKVSAETFA